MKSIKKLIFGLVLVGTVLVVSNALATGNGKPPGAPNAGPAAKYLDDDECCSDPGQMAECWWMDAVRDEVACLTDAECSPHTCVLDAAVFGGNPSPTGEGLCTCDYDPEDFLGGFGDCPGDGVCNPDGICGPSYCNGNFVCSCWGGCEEKLFGEEEYGSLAEYCAEEMVLVPYCCNGHYPNTPGTEENGHCTDDPMCSVADGGSDDDDTDSSDDDDTDSSDDNDTDSSDDNDTDSSDDDTADSDSADNDASIIDSSADESDDSNKCDCRMTGIPGRGGLVRFFSGVFQDQ